ncbi:Uncharacterised protein [Elizabethkingia meningoseptica]|nr:Uncharacterised protein [Elizabethkingia meningoseptica]
MFMVKMALCSFYYQIFNVGTIFFVINVLIVQLFYKKHRTIVTMW